MGTTPPGQGKDRGRKIFSSRVWFFHIALIVLFTSAFYILEAGDNGRLQSVTLAQRVYPLIQELSGRFENLKFRLRGRRPVKNKVVIVEIDDEAVTKLGRWPWHRDVFSYLVARTFEAGALVVGLDEIFAEQDQRVSPELRDLLKEHHLEERIPEFETDLVFEELIREAGPSLVLGWASGEWCQPAYSSDALCLGTKRPANMPPGFEKFAYGAVSGLGFDPTKTPLVTAPDLLINLPNYHAAARHAGYLQVWPDADGVIRRVNLAMMSGGLPYPAIALEMARIGLRDGLRIEFDDRHLVKRLGFVRSGRDLPVSPLGQLRINFRGPAYHFPYVPAVRLLEDRDEIQYIQGGQARTANRKELLKDAYVLIGLTALGTSDNRSYPFDPVTPGVEGHATVLDNILAGDALLTSLPLLGSLWLYLLMTVGAVGFLALLDRRGPQFAFLLFIASAIGFVLFDVGYLFAYKNIQASTALVYFEFAVLFVFEIGAKYVREERSKRFVKGAFSKYVAPAVVDAMLKEPDKLAVGGEKKPLTILFSDIRGFSSFSERMDPKQLTALLNDYLGLMTDVVFEFGGTLDKYIGDAIMAFWGAPLDQALHADNACRAAIKMIQVLEEHRPRYRAQYGVDVRIGIGLNSGSVNVGNMGSERIFAYTVIGDHVNLASRLEGVTKYYGVSIVAARYTLDAITQAGEPPPPHRVLDRVKVKGKRQAVELVQILAQPLPAEGLAAFEGARKLYEERRFAEAIDEFERAGGLLQAETGEPDGPSRLYIGRCRTLLERGPESDWDGSWEMTHK